MRLLYLRVESCVPGFPMDVYMVVCVFSRAFGCYACIVDLIIDCGAHPDGWRFNYHINEYYLILRGILLSNTVYNTEHGMD